MTSDGNASEATPESFRDRLVAEIPNLRAFAVSLSGSIQNEASAGTAEQRKDNRMLIQDVTLKNLAGITIKTEHRRI